MRTITLLGVAAILLVITPHALAAPVNVHPSNRYYTGVNGNPVFLQGYYDWASVDPATDISHPSFYDDMITQGAPYDMNYLRISLGINRMTGSTTPATISGVPLPVPFRYVGGLADLDQWDETFWDGLQYHAGLAAQHGVILHVALFDGVDFRAASGGGGDSGYRWPNSFWNVDNQVTSFYGDLDTNGNGSADQNGEFYRKTDFVNDTGVGRYQRDLIDKAVSELAGYENVFFEVGNELFGAPADWNFEVIKYIKTKTTRVVTVNLGTNPTNDQGFATHAGDTPAAIKSWVGSNVGSGVPAWVDPDGSALWNATADDLRRAAWYSFGGGAAGWGGFTTDFFTGGSGFNHTKANYYHYLQSFIQDSGVQFASMVPCQGLVGNNGENVCLSSAGSEYVAYVLNDASVTLNLSGLSGSGTARIYDPRTGTTTSSTAITGGSTLTFNKPAGADDWVVHVKSGVSPAGPRGFWRLDDNTGTSARDSSGGGLTGTLTNGPAWTSGQSSRALSFDGTNDYVNVGNPSQLQLTGAMTVSAWILRDNDGRIISKQGASGNRGWSFNIEPDGKCHFQIAPTSTTLQSVASVAAIPTGQWVHLSGVYTPGSALRLYVNGTLNNSNTTSIAASQVNSSNNVNIGRRPDNGLYFDGKIDEVRVYNRALSASELAGLAQ